MEETSLGKKLQKKANKEIGQCKKYCEKGTWWKKEQKYRKEWHAEKDLSET